MINFFTISLTKFLNRGLSLVGLAMVAGQIADLVSVRAMLP